MIDTILITLQIVGFLGIILGIELIVNTLTGMVYNMIEKGEKFSWKKLFQGIGKALVFYVSAGALSVAFTMLPYVNDMITDVFSIELISTETLNTLSTVGVLSIVIMAIITQGTKAMKGISNLINITNKKEEDK